MYVTVNYSRIRYLANVIITVAKNNTPKKNPIFLIGLLLRTIYLRFGYDLMDSEVSMSIIERNAVRRLRSLRLIGILGVMRLSLSFWDLVLLSSVEKGLDNFLSSEIVH